MGPDRACIMGKGGIVSVSRMLSLDGGAAWIVPVILMMTVVVSLLLYLCYIYKKRRENIRMSITVSENLRQEALELHILKCNLN